MCCRLILVLYSAGPGIKTVVIVLFELRMRLFDSFQAWVLCRYGCMCAFEVYVLLCVTVIVMSYSMSEVFFFECG